MCKEIKMDQKLLKYFSKIMPLTQQEADAIAATMIIRQSKKGDILLKEGQISTEAYFVLEGCVRQYFIIDGKEKTANFFTKEQWVISINSFSYRQPSTHYMECALDSVLVVGNREKEQDLYRRFPRLESVSRKVLEKVFAEQQQLMAVYITDNAEQRYEKLLHSRPELLQIIPQYQIASYIGVQPESLSRIRKRIMDKKRV